MDTNLHTNKHDKLILVHKYVCIYLLKKNSNLKTCEESSPTLVLLTSMLSLQKCGEGAFSLGSVVGGNDDA